MSELIQTRWAGFKGNWEGSVYTGVRLRLFHPLWLEKALISPKVNLKKLVLMLSRSLINTFKSQVFVAT